MNWHTIVFDLDQQPPGIEPQIAIALQIENIYRTAGFPKGFAVFHKWYVESMHYAFFFSPVASVHCAEIIRANSGIIFEKTIPEDAELTIGENAMRSLT